MFSRKRSIRSEFEVSLDDFDMQVSEFYTGKAAELAEKIKGYERHRNEIHSFAAANSVSFKAIVLFYTEIVALQSYADMNSTVLQVSNSKISVF